MTDPIVESITKHFKIKYYELLQEYQVHCPYHNDAHKSASINFKKKLFYCFTCNLGKTFEQIQNEIIYRPNTTLDIVVIPNSNPINNTDIFSFNPPKTSTPLTGNFTNDLANLLSQQTQTQRIKKDITQKECLKYAFSSMNEKGISSVILDKIGAVPIVNPNENYYGYIKFPTDNNGSFVARKFLPDDILEGERYLLSTGKKPLVGDITNNVEEYILVEGYLDYLSMKHVLGYENTICNLSTQVNAERAYKFKNKIVFVLFDNDFPGFEAARKANIELRRVNAYPIILDMPDKFGKDPNDAITHHRKEFEDWLQYYIKQSSATDTNYILGFGKEEQLYTLKSGIDIIDNDIFRGGYSLGLHAIAAKPGVGKTAYGLYLSHNIVICNPSARVLYITYEIPRKQCWARISSIYDTEHPWNEIEKDSIMTDAAKQMTLKLANNIRIVAGWDTSEIARAAPNYDFIVVDYIQRMPGDHSDEKTNVSKNIKALSRIMMEKEKIIFVISSIPRSSYDKEDLSVFKESGDIEFAIQSGMLLSDINKGGEHRLIKVTVLKNTRGPVGGSFWFEANMLHNTFKEIIPDI